MTVHACSLTSVACVEVKASPLAHATAMATCLINASFAEGMEPSAPAAWKKEPAITILTPSSRTVLACNSTNAVSVVEAAFEGACDCEGNVLDECGVCGGSGIPEGACDCDGNILDECGECGGDGIAEGACDCEGNVLDECGICGGSGIPDGECDCDGNVLDECGECGGDGIAEGACDCEGNVLDECGVCGGSGIPEGACDCDGNILDECGECGGDGIAEGACDCEGNVLDECGICGGSGIPDGECDCDGNVLDECGVCDGDGYLGCTNPEACNYDAGACGDDGSCDVPFQGCQECVDGEATPIDSDGDGINDCEEVPGCTDSTACNYDEAANASDGSCEYAADYYDCTGSCLNDADGDEICDELEIAGCQDEMACNYNVEATDAGDVIMLRKDLTVTATASLEKTATVFAAVRMFSTNVGFVVGTTVTAWMIAVFPTATTALVQTPAVSLMVTTALVLMIVEFPLVTTRHASWDALMNQRAITIHRQRLNHPAGSTHQLPI